MNRKQKGNEEFQKILNFKQSTFTIRGSGKTEKMDRK